MAAREFKTIKELFIHPDAKENWNFMRFLSEFHCWLDDANSEWNMHLFHDTIYEDWNAVTGNSTETLFWDAEVPAIKIADSDGLHWFPYKNNDSVYGWAVITDEYVDRVLSFFEKFLKDPNNNLSEKIRRAKLDAVVHKIEQTKAELAKLEEEKKTLVVTPVQENLEKEYLGKWVIIEDENSIYHVKSIKPYVGDGPGSIIITADHSFMFSMVENQEGHDNLELAACDRTYVKIYDTANRVIVDDPMPFIKKSLEQVNTWLTEYIKEGQG